MGREGGQEAEREMEGRESRRVSGRWEGRESRRESGR